MDAEAFRNHAIHSRLETLTENLKSTFPEWDNNSETRAIVKKVEYLIWCLENTDHQLVTKDELDRFNQNLSDAINQVPSFQRYYTQFDRQLSSAFAFFSNPRNHKIAKADSLPLFRELDAKIIETERWQEEKNIELKQWQEAKNKEIERWQSEKEKETTQLITSTEGNLESIRSNHVDEYEKWVSQGIAKFRKWRSILDKNVISQREYVDREIDASKSKVGKLEELFLKKLKLEAPTKYWEDKAAKHRKIAWWSSVTFIIVIIIALCAFIKVGWPTMVDIISELASQENAGFAALLPVSLLLIPTLSVAWILRHISRLIIQNFSLAEDADVRRNIALTFLAITKNKENVDAEMALVLQALFRPLDGSGHAEIPPPQLDEVIKMVARK